MAPTSPNMAQHGPNMALPTPGWPILGPRWARHSKTWPQRGPNMAWTYLSLGGLGVPGVIDHPVFTGHSPSEEVNLVSTCLQHGRRMNWVQAGPNMASTTPLLFHLAPPMSCWQVGAVRQQWFHPQQPTPGQRLRMPQRNCSGAAGCPKPGWTSEWPAGLSLVMVASNQYVKYSLSYVH